MLQHFIRNFVKAELIDDGFDSFLDAKRRGGFKMTAMLVKFILDFVDKVGPCRNVEVPLAKILKIDGALFKVFVLLLTLFSLPDFLALFGIRLATF